MTYEHLQKLSLEYFGGKRTGDLIARVSSDTDRICNFLSINLLDFATDVLMIVLTAVMLVELDPILAAADAPAVPDDRLAGPPGPRPAAPRVRAGAAPGPR